MFLAVPPLSGPLALPGSGLGLEVSTLASELPTAAVAGRFITGLGGYAFVMALPLEARSCLLFLRSSMDKDTSFAKDGGEPELAAMGSAAFRYLASPELLETRTWERVSIFLWLAPSRRSRTALQCHLEAAGAVHRKKFEVSSRNVGSGGLLGSGWYLGGLEACLTELYLEKVLSRCVAGRSVPSEPVSWNCHPTAKASSYGHRDTESSRESQEPPPNL